MKRIINFFEILFIVLAFPLIVIFVLSVKIIDYHHMSFFLSLIPFRFGQLIRREFYKHTLDNVGKNFNIYYGAIISRKDITIGDNVRIGPYNSIGKCVIGNDVILAQNVHILSGRHQHSIDKIEIPINQQAGIIETIHISDNVWIGAGSIVMSDIGSGCVVGAGSVVVKCVAGNTIVAGNPAKFIKNRVVK